MEDERTLDEIYDAICKRLQERYTEQGQDISDEEVKKAADNWLRFCNKLIEIEMKKK